VNRILNSVGLLEVVYLLKCMAGLGPKLCGEGFVTFCYWYYCNAHSK